jgi:hypothetical protein
MRMSKGQCHEMKSQIAIISVWSVQGDLNSASVWVSLKLLQHARILTGHWHEMKVRLEFCFQWWPDVHLCGPAWSCDRLEKSGGKQQKAFRVNSTNKNDFWLENPQNGQCFYSSNQRLPIATIDISWVDWAYKSSTCDVMYCQQRRHLYYGGQI